MTLLQELRDTLLPVAARCVPRPRSGDQNTLLIIRPDHLGDIVLSQPAVRYIRSARPNNRLVAVVGPWSEDIVRLMWDTDEIITVPFPGFHRSERRSLTDPYVTLFREAWRLRQLRAGSAIVLRDDAWWAAWLAAMSVPGDVVTGDDARARAFATRHVDCRGCEHAVDFALHIAAGFVSSVQESREFDACLYLAIPAEVQARAHRMLASAGVQSPYIVVHPGAGADVKLWPLHRWRSVMNNLREINVIVTGVESERSLCDEIATGFNHVTSLAGVTDVLTLAGVLSDAELVVGTDNGPLHLAVATGTRTVQLFGPSRPERFGAWGERDKHVVVSAGWICPRCADLSVDRPAGCGCMLAISAEDVVDEVKKSLAAHAV